MLKAVKLAEILKRKIVGLHQINTVSEILEEWVYIPLEEGLDEVKLKKEISVLEITLSDNVSPVHLKSYGYQSPLDEEEVQGSV